MRESDSLEPNLDGRRFRLSRLWRYCFVLVGALLLCAAGCACMTTPWYTICPRIGFAYGRKLSMYEGYSLETFELHLPPAKSECELNPYTDEYHARAKSGCRSFQRTYDSSYISLDILPEGRLLPIIIERLPAELCVTYERGKSGYIVHSAYLYPQFFGCLE